MKKMIPFALISLASLLSSCTVSFGLSSKNTSSSKGDVSSEDKSSYVDSSSEGTPASSETSSSSSSKPVSSSKPTSSTTPLPSSSSAPTSSPIAASSSSSSSTSGYVPSGYSLKWSDEFEGSSLNSSYWTAQLGDGTDYGITGWGNSEAECYTANNATVGSGELKITAKKETASASGHSYNYTSSRLRTAGKITTTYGYVEARIKLPAIQGMWPAFWMLPEGTYQSKGWPTSGELDIMENKGREPNIVGGTTHSANDSYADVYHTESYTLSSSIENWHVYAMEWTSEAVKFSADGHVYNTVTRSTWVNGCSLYNGGPAPFNAPFHIILNLAVGGQYDGYQMPPDNFVSAAMEVDYVRIYQQ